MPGVLVQLSDLYRRMKTEPKAISTGLCVARVVAIILTIARFVLFAAQLKWIDVLKREYEFPTGRMVGFVLAEAIITIVSVGVVLWAMTRATAELEGRIK